MADESALGACVRHSTELSEASGFCGAATTAGTLQTLRIAIEHATKSALPDLMRALRELLALSNKSKHTHDDVAGSAALVGPSCRGVAGVDAASDHCHADGSGRDQLADHEERIAMLEWAIQSLERCFLEPEQARAVHAGCSVLAADGGCAAIVAPTCDGGFSSSGTEPGDATLGLEAGLEPSLGIAHTYGDGVHGADGGALFPMGESAPIRLADVLFLDADDRHRIWESLAVELDSSMAVKARPMRIVSVDRQEAAGLDAEAAIFSPSSEFTSHSGISLSGPLAAVEFLVARHFLPFL